MIQHEPQRNLSKDQAAAEALRLDNAERGRLQVTQSTLLHPTMTLDDAYAVQGHWYRLKQARGERLVGHKIGLTSRAMQLAMNINTPDSGFLTDQMVFEAGSQLETDRFTDPKLEVELAFVLGHDLDGAEPSVESVLEATDYVTPALELLAARSHRRDPETNRTRTVVDTISDNAANAGIIVGGNKVGPREVDLEWVHAILRRNGTIEETGVAAAVLDHPANGIVWLARRYHDQGLQLKAGEIILAGSFTRPVDVHAGDQFSVDFNQLGSFELAFSRSSLEEASQ